MKTEDDIFWAITTEFKTHCYYIHEYLVSSEKCERRINIFLAITSCSSIAGWAIWSDFSVVWASIIAISQVITAIRPYLPFNARIKPLRELSYSFEDLFLEYENLCYKISKGELTEDEIHEHRMDLSKRKNDSWRKIIGDLTLPHKDSLHELSKQLAKTYFTTHYYDGHS